MPARPADYDPRPVGPPAGPLTPLLIARQTLPCISCAMPIRAGDPVHLEAAGWRHALHGGAA